MDKAEKNYRRSILICLTFLTVFFGIFLLIIAKNILIPIALAMFLTILLISIINKMKKRKFPNFLIILIILGGSIVFIYFIYKIFLINIIEFGEQAGFYQTKLEGLWGKFHQILIQYNISIGNPLEKIDFQGIITKILSGIRSVGTVIFLVILYSMFFIWQRKVIYNKFTILFSNKNVKTLKNISDGMEDYIFYKTMISLLTSLVSYMILLIFQVDFPILWAMIIFLLNYIPTIGSSIAVFITCCFSLIQYGNLVIPFVLILFLFAVQMFFGNYMEPKLLGERLDINPIFIILSVVVGGAIWGIVGMFLAVPFLSILNLISKEIDAMKKVHIILRKE